MEEDSRWSIRRLVRSTTRPPSYVGARYLLYTMIFCPLHNHSEYSALDGLSTPKEIAERAVELGCPCCALTDHGTVAGHLEFAKEMEKHGIKPIFGAELYHGIKPKGYTGWTRNERDQ